MTYTEQPLWVTMLAVDYWICRQPNQRWKLQLIYVRIDDKMFGRFLDEEIYYNGRVIGLHHQ